MLPLRGVKICDLSRVLAGPYATQILGDMGADVLKVEEPTRGDDTRSWGPPHFEGTSSYYLTANRNKKAIALDFQNEKDLQRLHQFLAKADVLVENFKVGSLAHYGLDYESLKKKYPRLIYCSITGFGQSGPFAKEPGYDVLIQAMAGLMSITGPNASTPTKVGVAVADLCTGLYAAVGILAALREREQSGEGQLIDLALYDTQVSLLANVGMGFLTTSEIPQPMGNRHPSIVPYGAYPTKDKQIMLTAGNDKQFSALCRCLDQTWDSDSRYATNSARVANRATLEDMIANRLKQKNRDEWMTLFKGRGFPFGPIQNLQEVAAHAQTKARDLFTTMNDGRTPCIRSPLRFSRTPILEYRTPPKLNQDSKIDW